MDAFGSHCCFLHSEGEPPQYSSFILSWSHVLTCAKRGVKPQTTCGLWLGCVAKKKSNRIWHPSLRICPQTSLDILGIGMAMVSPCNHWEGCTMSEVFISFDENGMFLQC